LKRHRVIDLCLNNQDFKKKFTFFENIQAGVYAWGYVNNDAQFIPIYVGTSKNIFARIKAHLFELKYGKYKILPNSIYKNKTPNRDCIIVNPAMNKANEIEIEIALGIFFWNKYLYRESFNYILSRFRFLYCEIENENDRRDAEKYLIHQIGKHRLIKSKKSIIENIDHKLANLIDEVFGNYYKDYPL